MITVGDKKYKVTENMGYNHDRCVYAKFVLMEDGSEKVVIRDPGSKVWRFAESLIIPRSHYVGQDNEK